MSESASRPQAEGEQASPNPTVNEVSTLQNDDNDDNNDNDGLELQIALDSLAVGNLEPLKNHLARIQGLDPQQYSIRTTPFRAQPDAKLSFIGEMDHIGEPQSEIPTSPPRPPRVQLNIPKKMYKYGSLQPDTKQIRLMRLGSKDSENIIHTLELKVFELSQAPRFYALSYVWGQPDKIMPLSCNGERIMITQNLFRAINKSFERYPDVWLWADGICINQDDLIERGRQVSMMGDIYSRAALVIAHTGHHRYSVGHYDYDSDSDPDSELTSSTVETRETNQMIGKENSQVNEALHSTTIDNDNEAEPSISSGTNNDFETTSFPDPSQPAISLMNYLSRIWSFDEDYSVKADEDWKKRKLPGVEGENEKIWFRLFDFWNEDWFYRSWVLQEAVLGKKVILLVDDTACSLDFIMQFWDRAKRRDVPEILKHGPLADEYSRILNLNPVSAIKALRDSKHPKSESVTANIDDEDRDRNEDAHEDARASVEAKAEEGSNNPKSSAQPGTRSDLLNLLSLFRTNLASDSRDTIYSLLGLVKGDSLADTITPDYSKTHTPTVLYRTVAAKFIESGLGPELLQYSGIDHRIPNLPSWAPDWSHQSRSNVHAHLYNCSGASRASLSVSENEPEKLRVRGVVIDTIRWNAMAWRYYSIDRGQSKFAPFREASDVTFPPFTDEDSRCVIRTMAKKGAEEYCSKFDASEGLEAALARTLVMDCTWRGQRTKSDPSFLNSFNAFERLYAEAPDENTPDTVHVYKSGIFHWVWDFADDEATTLRGESWPFAVALQNAHKGRRFCATAEGYMCTAPYDAERGDVIIILEGLRMPFVLRRSGDDDNDWKLVGDCYVHGIMDGELIVPLKDKEVGTDEMSVDVNGEPFAVRTLEGFAKFQEFSIV